MDNIRIAYRNLDPSPFVEEQIHQRAGELLQLHDRITSFRVVMESNRHGNGLAHLFHVNVGVAVPGAEIVVREERDDLYAAVREAFDTARRRLTDHNGKQHRR